MAVESWVGGAVVVVGIAQDSGGAQAMGEWRSAAVRKIKGRWWCVAMVEDGGKRAMVGGDGVA